MDKITKNAKVVAELARLFPNSSISAIMRVLDMPQIDKNNAIWYAQGAGFIEDIGVKDLSKTVVPTSDKKTTFQESDQARGAITYAMHQLAKEEVDMAEFTLMEWMGGGYPLHYQSIAIAQMLEDKSLASYVILEDTPKGKNGKGGVATNPYVFYTLPENEHEHWGFKQFKDVKILRLKEDSK